jgi:hypothetical protein
MQHCFDFLPLPQAHGEFLPNFFIADLIAHCWNPPDVGTVTPEL